MTVKTDANNDDAAKVVTSVVVSASFVESEELVGSTDVKLVVIEVSKKFCMLRRFWSNQTKCSSTAEIIALDSASVMKFESKTKLRTCLKAIKCFSELILLAIVESIRLNDSGILKKEFTLKTFVNFLNLRCFNLIVIIMNKVQNCFQCNNTLA